MGDSWGRVLVAALALMEAAKDVGTVPLKLPVLLAAFAWNPAEAVAGIILSVFGP